MQRREFITFIGSMVAWPLAARAQPSAMPVIGWLSATSPDQYPDIAAAFERGLAESGYVVGRNVTIERRWARGNYDRLPELAQELVRLNPALILVGGNAVALAVRRATSTIAVVKVKDELGNYLNLLRQAADVVEYKVPDETIIKLAKVA
jgi:putative tryptophan/tyrosine transport system substrate-binding protein